MINVPISPFVFARTPDIHFGAGKLGELGQRIKPYGSRVLLLTGEAWLRKSGRLSGIESDLSAQGIEYHALAVKGEPSSRFVDSACEKFRGMPFDAVVGIGGGSVIDAAKALSAMLPQDGSILDYLEDVGRGRRHDGRKIPCIAIPTTSGTGSEATKNAVITDMGPRGFKKSLRHDNFVPDCIIVDPELMVSCPSDVTAACGMDAFTQLFEAYLSPAGSPLTEALALSGLERIKDNLIGACTDQAQDLNTRGNMAYASLLSGVVLANAGLGIVHGLASPLGGRFPIPHGVVCGTLVGAATRVNLRVLQRENNENALQKLAKVGALFADGNSGSSQGDCEALISILDNWTRLLAIPKLGTYGIRETDLNDIVSETKCRNNPVKLSREEIREILVERL